MTNEYLRPPDLRTHLDTPSGTASKRPHSKSVTTSTSRTSWTSSLAEKLAKKSRDPTVRAELDKAGYGGGHHKSRSEGKPTSHNRDPEGLSPLPGNLEIGALFDLVDHRLPPTLVLIPPTAPPSVQASDHNMANNNPAPLGIWEAARLLSSHGCKVRMLPIPANTASTGRPVSPNTRARQNPLPAQGQGRADRSLEAALDSVRRNGGEVEFSPHIQGESQMVACDILGCEQIFMSVDGMEQHKRLHPYCVECEGHYALEQSHEEHRNRHHH